MTRRISLFITIVAAALMLGVPTATAVGVPGGLPVHPLADSESAVVVPTRAPTRSGSTVRPPGRVLFPGGRGAPSTSAPVPVATTSSSELAWSQIGIGFGVGIAFILAVYLVMRTARQRELAH